MKLTLPKIGDTWKFNHHKDLKYKFISYIKDFYYYDHVVSDIPGYTTTCTKYTKFIYKYMLNDGMCKEN